MIITSEKTFETEFLNGFWRKSFKLIFRSKNFRKLKLGYQIWTNTFCKICKKTFIQVWRKSLELFLRYSLSVSFPVCITLISGFSILTKTWKYYLYTHLVLCIKFYISIFIILKLLITKYWPSSHTHTYAQTNF